MRLQTFPGTILHMALIRSLLVTPVDSIIFDLAGLLDGSLLPRWLSVKSSEVANLHRSRIDTACCMCCIMTACRTGQVCVWGRASSWCPTARRMLRTCCTCSVGCSLCFVLPLCFCVCFEAQVFCVCSGFQPWLFRSVTGSASITLGNTSKGGAPRRTPATETLLQKEVHSSELLDNSWLNRWSLCEAKEEARSANRGHGVLDSGPCSSSMWSP